MATAKVKLPEFRISPAAVGRRLASVVLRANQGELSGEDFMDTITAVFNSCVSEETASDPEANINTEVLAAEQAEIEKSVRRSRAARKAAARRRQMKENQSCGIRAVTEPSAEESRVSQDSSRDIRSVAVSLSKVEAEASPARSNNIPSPATEEPEEEPEEIIVESKYDAYGVRRRWY